MNNSQYGLLFVLVMLMIIALSKTLLPDFIVGITALCGSAAFAMLSFVIMSDDGKAYEQLPVKSEK